MKTDENIIEEDIKFDDTYGDSISYNINSDSCLLEEIEFNFIKKDEYPTNNARIETIILG